ncbi:MAG: insulinase family protein [Bdellovibrionales bacterium]|nr:insulinase family protein [Bdellovibrionales bacterium]
MRKLRWDFPIRTEIISWRSELVFNLMKMAGIPHLMEHLLVRAVNSYISSRKIDYRARINGATTPDIFYVHSSTGINAPLLWDDEKLAKFLFASNLTEVDFEIERKIILSEISERQTLANKIQSFILKEYKKKQCLLGRKEQISQMKWSDVREIFESISSLFEHYVLEPQKIWSPIRMPKSTGPYQRLNYDMRRLNFGKRHIFLLIVSTPTDTIFESVRLSFLDHLLRHSMEGDNLNQILRDKFQISYGVHGLQVQRNQKKVLAFISISENAFPKDLLDKVEILIKNSIVRMKEEFSLINEKLFVEKHLYKNIHNLLGVLPQALQNLGASDIEFMLDQDNWDAYKKWICNFELIPTNVKDLRENKYWTN